MHHHNDHIYYLMYDVLNLRGKSAVYWRHNFFETLPVLRILVSFHAHSSNTLVVVM